MYTLILSYRYMFRRRISYLALLAVALCVFIAVVVMTVMTGLVEDFKQKNHAFVGDCVVGTQSLVGFAYYDEFVRILDDAEFVEAVSPVIKSYALISPQWEQRSYGVEIMGIDPLRHSRATDFGRTLHYRRADISKAFEPTYDPNLDGCVLGIDLRLARDTRGGYSFRASASQDVFSLSCFPLTAKGALARAGTTVVNTGTFYFSDISQSGLAHMDSSVVYIPFEKAQLLCGMNGPDKRANAIHIRFKPGIPLDIGCARVRVLWEQFNRHRADQTKADLLDTVRVQSWSSYCRSSIAAVEKEQVLMTVMFILVGITTVFIVFVVFYMIICHKSKDIGILKCVGASNGAVARLFTGFAILVGVLGSLVGVALGWLFLANINSIESWLFNWFRFQLWDRSIYAIGDIPHQTDFRVFSAVVFCAVVACLIGALVPSLQAARLRLVEALQVDQL